MRAILVQHAEKLSNPGDPDLTPTGRRQALRLGQALAGVGAQALVSSPYLRAQSTAGAIGDSTGLRIATDYRLRERMAWDGSESLDEFLRDWDRSSLEREWRPPSGESSREAGRRFISCVDEYAQLVGCAIFVTHGGVTCDALRTQWGDEGLAEFHPDWLAGVPSAAISTVEITDAEWRPVSIASTGHLRDLD